MDIPTTDKKQSEVQDILDKYAPAHLHDLFDVGDLAAKVRRNPLYIKEVEDMAKNARFSDYGMYDKDIEWAVIEGKAISLIENAWGITPQSGDSVLIDVIKMNDTNIDVSERINNEITNNKQQNRADLVFGIGYCVVFDISRTK